MRRRHNGKKKYWIIGVVLLVAVIAAVAVIRIRSLKSEMKYDPVTKGEAYENYNKYGTIRDKVNCRKHAYDTFISEFYEEIFIKEGIEYIE